MLQRHALCRRAPVLAALALAACSTTAVRHEGGVDKLTYHYDAARTGWNAAERTLTPASVASSRFGLLWETPQLDSAGAVPPRLFATPLYVHDLEMPGPGAPRARRAVIFAASTTGYAYAIDARPAAGTPPGAILWRRQLTARPCMRGTYGVLGTPVIDRRAQRLYVAYCDETDLWHATALDLGTGEPAAGWPVTLTGATVNVPGVRRNGDTRFPDKLPYLQRSALNLSPDGSRLYVTFGGEPTPGWVLSIDTARPRVASAFSATAKTEEGVGGMWGAGGPAVDRDGQLYVSTGSSVLNTLAGMGVAGVFPDSPHNWGQSVIRLADSMRDGLTLTGTYTPFNYCQVGARDMDLGSSTPVLVDVSPSQTATPRLLDRSRMPGDLVKRQPCSTDSASDRSLLAPEPQPQFGRPGPLNVFGPYTESNGMGDQARSRTTLAWFRDAGGRHYLYLTGSAKQSEESPVSVAPGLVRVRIVMQRGQPAFLRLDATQPDLVFQNPGSPVVTSNGARDAIVWILDENRPRSASLYGADAPQPVLYAVDAATTALLWKSPAGELKPSGKYNEPTVVDGQVIVGTDRIQVYGLRGR
jgi:outer membrane protein assembly factor BamB